jgi:hypothetical protein
MQYRDNEVTFAPTGGYQIIKGVFTVDDASVTSGQDPDGHIHKGLVATCGSNGVFSFSIGRKGSSGVANWFNSRIPASRNTFNHTAGELNFAMIGKLELVVTGGILGSQTGTYVFNGIALAQGHSGSSNNWWFGGTECSNYSSNTVLAKGQDSKGNAISFLFVRGDNGVSTVNFQPQTLYDTANWMKRLQNGLRLDQIMMPGSHDAGMSELHHCAPPVGADGATKTQSQSVGNQLLSGSRYFDIRVDYDYGQLVTYHRTDGWGCNGQNLDVVLNQAKQFLASNPSEFVILKFSHIRDYDDHHASDTKALINNLLNNYNDILYKAPLPTTNVAEVKLGDARGKLIAVFDYSEFIDPSLGRLRYMDGSKPASAANLTVYDEYSDTNDYAKMASDQLQKWAAHGGAGQGFLFLLSWTLTATATGSVASLAAKANGNLPSVLSNQLLKEHWSKPNIVYLDFIDSTVCQSVIQYNFV